MFYSECGGCFDVYNNKCWECEYRKYCQSNSDFDPTIYDLDDEELCEVLDNRRQSNE